MKAFLLITLTLVIVYCGSTEAINRLERAIGFNDFFGRPYVPPTIYPLQTPEKTVYCNKTSCLHGGRCDGFKCTCVGPYYGRSCEFINLCYNGPCDQNHICNQINTTTYECVCAIGYTGSDCSIMIDYCESGPCQNGGNCSMIDYPYPAYQCECPSNYYGKNCEYFNYCHPEVNSTALMCFNGGTCVSTATNFKCFCPPWFTGNRCQSRIIIKNRGFAFQ